MEESGPFFRTVFPGGLRLTHALREKGRKPAAIGNLGLDSYQLENARPSHCEFWGSSVSAAGGSGGHHSESFCWGRRGVPGAMYNMMSSVFVAASAIVPSPAPMPAAKPANINAAIGLASFPPFAVIAPMPAVTTASPAPIAAPRLAPSPRPSFEGDVIVRMSDFGITAQPEGLRRSRSDADRPRNWPLIRSPAFSSTTMGDAISKAETFSHRPGITSACAGCAISPPRIKERIWVRQDFIFGIITFAPPSFLKKHCWSPETLTVTVEPLLFCPPWVVPTKGRRYTSTNVIFSSKWAHRDREFTASGILDRVGQKGEGR